jgi:hypothetical protein
MRNSAGLPIRNTAVALAVFAVSIVLNPYMGIRQDSILYLGQALQKLYPAPFASDLFFQYGSQASFTIFPAVTAKLLQSFAPADLFLYATLGARIIFACATWWLLRALFSSYVSAISTVLVLLLPSGYGFSQTFGYSESFFTARTIAEPLVLIGIGAALRKRYFAAVALIILAGALHPLQALPALGVTGLLIINTWRNRIFAASVLALLLTFASTCSTQIEGLLSTRIDAQWFSWLQGPSSNLFMTQWASQDWANLATDFFLAVLFLRQSKAHAARFAIAVILTAGFSVALNIVLAGYYHFALATALQFWRAQWLLHLMVVGALPTLFLAQFKSHSGRAPLLILALLCLSGFSFGWETPAAAGVPFVLIAIYVGVHQFKPSATFTYVVYLIIGAVTCLLIYGYANLAYRYYKTWGFDALTYVSLVLCFCALVLLALMAKSSRPIAIHSVACFLLGLVAIGAVAMWDRRDPKIAALENVSMLSVESNPQLQALPVDAQILWDDRLLYVWMWFRRANFISQPQLAGIVFNRDTAKEAYSRIEKIKIADKNGPCIGTLLKKESDLPQCTFDDSVVRRLCANTAGQNLYIILDVAIELPAEINGRSESLRIRSNVGGYNFYLYPCTNWNALENAA